MKAFNLIFFVLFVLCAALQYNDPDPYLWIPIYGYAAVLCWMAFRGRFFPTAYLAGIGVYSVYAVYKVFEKDGVLDWIKKHGAENIATSMKAESPWIEITREFLGLVILIIVLLVDYLYSRKQLSKKT